MSKIQGLAPILATPFESDGTLDLGSMSRLTEFVLASGADAVAVFGIASEGHALSSSERAAILETTVFAAGDRPVVAGVNAISLGTALDQATEAADGGASALMVLPPYLLKPSPAQLVDFYGSLAERIGLPIMVQDAPATTGVSMPVPLIVELSQLPGIASVKIEAPPTASKIAAAVRATSDDFGVLGGQNALFALEELAAGAIGLMPACEFTDALRLVMDDWERGEHARARHAFRMLLPLIRFGMQRPLSWAVHKEVLVRRGVIRTAAVRAPGVPLDEDMTRWLDDILLDLALPSFVS